MSDRRRFLQDTGLLLAGTTFLSALDNKAFAIFKNGIAPSDQINVGAIGINGIEFKRQSDLAPHLHAALRLPINGQLAYGCGPLIYQRESANCR